MIGHGGWEVRADRLGSGRSVLAGSGFLDEACTEGIDSYFPSLPAADGDAVWFWCTIERLDTPALTSRAYHPHPPFD